jgi:hypothetical protein
VYKDIKLYFKIIFIILFNPFISLAQYEGGKENNDNVTFLINSICTPLHLNLFAGGNDESINNSQLINTSCTRVYLNLFAGGNDESIINSQLINTSCTPVHLNLFAGGNDESKVNSLLILNEQAKGGSASVSKSFISLGSSTTLTLSNYVGKIQWQQSTNGLNEWVDVLGGTGDTTNSFTTPNLFKDTYYRAILTSGSCSFDISNIVSVMTKIEPVLANRSLYVNDFYLILGDENQENALIEYAQCMEFNQLYLRRMRNCQLWHDENRVKLRNFIRKAKKSGIKSVGVFTESANSIYNNKIDLYNQEASDELEFIDAFHLDFHYWHSSHPQEYYCKQYLNKNGFSCDNRGAFDFFLTQLDLFQEIKSGYKYPVEISLALERVQDDEAEILQKYFAAGYINNIHFTIYRKPNSQNEINLYNFNSQKERLRLLNNDYQGIEVVPVFLTHDKAGLHLGEWLQRSGTIKDAENNYLEGFKNEENPEVNNNILLRKAAWSKYTDMPICIKENKWNTPQKLNAYSSLKIVEEKAIQIYNTQNEIFVNFKTDENADFNEGYMQIFSVDGKLIQQETLANFENNISVKVIKGIYIVKISQGNYQETQKIVLGE